LAFGYAASVPGIASAAGSSSLDSGGQVPRRNMGVTADKAARIKPAGRSKRHLTGL